MIGESRETHDIIIRNEDIEAEEAKFYISKLEIIDTRVHPAAMIRQDSILKR